MQPRTPLIIAAIVILLGFISVPTAFVPVHAQEMSTTPCEAPTTPATSDMTVITSLTLDESLPTLPSIRITKLLPDPTGDDTLGEMIELQNNGSTDTDLTGWIVKTTSGKSFTLSGMLEASKTRELPYSETKLVLANAGTTIYLLGPAGTTHDTVTYSNAKTGQLYIRNTDDSWSWQQQVTQTSTTQNATTPQAVASSESSTNAQQTPGSASTTPTSVASTPIAPQPLPTTTAFIPLPNIRIVRFIPDPIGSDDAEWIEIRNESDAPATLDGWKIDDEEGGSTPHKIPRTAVAPHTILRIERATSGLALNNDGDSVRLISPTGTLIDSVTYGIAPEGAVYEKTNDSWVWVGGKTATASKQISPNTLSIHPDPSRGVESTSLTSPTSPEVETSEADAAPVQLSETTSIQELSSLEPGTEVTIDGVVSLPLGIAGKRIFAMQDTESGIFLQIFGNTVSSFRVGDTMRVTGSVRERAGKTYLATTSAKITLVGRSRITYKPIPISDISIEHSGMTAVVRGVVSKRTASTLTLADESLSKEVALRIPSTKSSNAAPGTTIDVSGVIRAINDGFEILPTDPSPIALIEPTKSEETSEKIASYETPLTADSKPSETPTSPGQLASKNPFSWAALAAASSTAAAFFFGKKRPTLV